MINELTVPIRQASRLLFTTHILLRSVNDSKTATAYQVIILRTAISAIAVTSILLVMFLNWSSWSTTQKDTLLTFDIYFIIASLSLVVNVAHLRSMTVVYKFYSIVVFLIEFAVFTFFAVIITVTSIVYYLSKPLTLLSNIGKVSLSSLIVVASYNYLLVVLGTPSGALNTTIKTF